MAETELVSLVNLIQAHLHKCIHWISDYVYVNGLYQLFTFTKGILFQGYFILMFIRSSSLTVSLHFEFAQTQLEIDAISN